MRPLINFQLLLPGTLHKNSQSSRVVARDDIVDAVADHDEGEVLSRICIGTGVGCVDIPCFGDVQNAGWGGLGRAEVASDDWVEGGDVRGEVC